MTLFTNESQVYFKTLIWWITRVNLSCCCCHTLKQKEMPLMQIWAGQLLLTSEEFLTTWLVLFVSHEFGPFLRPLESSWCSIKKFWNKKIRTEIKLKKQTKKNLRATIPRWISDKVCWGPLFTELWLDLCWTPTIIPL